jgi:hypothetical protein
MAIRPRGKSWQVDIRLIDGSRLRRTFATEAAATEAETAMRPNPQQRAAAKKKRFRKSSARKNKHLPGSTSPSGERSSNIAEISDQTKSNLTMLQPSQPNSETTNPDPDTPTPTPSEAGCGEQEPATLFPVSRAWPGLDLGKRSSKLRNLKAR